MSFADQRGMLKNALEAAGIAPNAAAQIAAILANTKQDSIESSRARADTTPESLRFVDKDTRKQVLTNLDFRADDPDYRQQLLPTLESPNIPQPMPNVTERLAPQQTQAIYDVSGGNLAEASGQGDSVSVGVRSRIANTPAGSSTPLAMLDAKGNTIVGKALRATAGSDGGSVRADVRESAGSVTVDVALEALEKMTVVTGVSYEPGIGIKLQHAPVSAWRAGAPRTSFIGMKEIRVATEVVDDLVGPRTHTAYIPAFKSLPHVDGHPLATGNRGEDIYFNLVRIGKFTGAWERETAKTVTQVWPEDGEDVDVWNYIADVAATEDGEENYVFFIARSEDKVPEQDVRGEDENPYPKLTTPPPTPALPAARNYAIAIQPSTKCNAVSSIVGKLAEEITGFLADAPSALSYAITGESAAPCLRWRRHEVDVITNVSIDAGGLIFERKRLYVLGEGDPVAPVIIPVGECGCMDDTECPEFECCVDGQCVPCPPPCSECLPEECCIEGACAPCPPPTCLSPEDCAPENCCVDNECVPCAP